MGLLLPKKQGGGTLKAYPTYQYVPDFKARYNMDLIQPRQIPLPKTPQLDMEAIEKSKMHSKHKQLLYNQAQTGMEALSNMPEADLLTRGNLVIKQLNSVFNPAAIQKYENAFEMSNKVREDIMPKGYFEEPVAAYKGNVFVIDNKTNQIGIVPLEEAYSDDIGKYRKLTPGEYWNYYDQGAFVDEVEHNWASGALAAGTGWRQFREDLKGLKSNLGEISKSWDNSVIQVVGNGNDPTQVANVLGQYIQEVKKGGKRSNNRVAVDRMLDSIKGAMLSDGTWTQVLLPRGYELASKEGLKGGALTKRANEFANMILAQNWESVYTEDNVDKVDYGYSAGASGGLRDTRENVNAWQGMGYGFGQEFPVGNVHGNVSATSIGTGLQGGLQSGFTAKNDDGEQVTKMYHAVAHPEVGRLISAVSPNYDITAGGKAINNTELNKIQLSPESNAVYTQVFTTTGSNGRQKVIDPVQLPRLGEVKTFLDAQTTQIMNARRSNSITNEQAQTMYQQVQAQANQMLAQKGMPGIKVTSAVMVTKVRTFGDDAYDSKYATKINDGGKAMDMYENSYDSNLTAGDSPDDFAWFNDDMYETNLIIPGVSIGDLKVIGQADERKLAKVPEGTQTGQAINWDSGNVQTGWSPITQPMTPNNSYGVSSLK